MPTDKFPPLILYRIILAQRFTVKTWLLSKTLIVGVMVTQRWRTEGTPQQFVPESSTTKTKQSWNLPGCTVSWTHRSLLNLRAKLLNEFLLFQVQHRTRVLTRSVCASCWFWKEPDWFWNQYGSESRYRSGPCLGKLSQAFKPGSETNEGKGNSTGTGPVRPGSSVHSLSRSGSGSVCPLSSQQLWTLCPSNRKCLEARSVTGTRRWRRCAQEHGSGSGTGTWTAEPEHCMKSLWPRTQKQESRFWPQQNWISANEPKHQQVLSQQTEHLLALA